MDRLECEWKAGEQFGMCVDDEWKEWNVCGSLLDSVDCEWRMGGQVGV